ncbi:MAG: hypothetical protein JO006_02120 [Paucibacter sp.]|nr:hypothetical protein [Roseateles sp.]
MTAIALTAFALTAAVRASGRRDESCPVIVVASGHKPLPSHVKIRARIRGDSKLARQLLEHVNELKGELD